MLADELEAVAKSLRRIADMPPNEQPSYPNGIRPWSTNEANHNAEVAERACAALRAAEPAPEDVDMVAAENAAGSANLVTCDGYYEFDLEALTQAFAKHRALGIAQGRAEATAEIVALRRHTEWISTALHVLRGMCRSAGLKQGAAKADEMIQVTEELLRGDHRGSE